MDWLNNTLESWKDYYYTEPFEIICLTIALITGSVFGQKKPLTIIFLIYALIGLLSLIYQIYVTHILVLQPALRGVHIYVMNLVVSYIELATFMFFFYNTLLISKLKTFLSVYFTMVTLANTLILYQAIYPHIAVDVLRKTSTLIITFQLLPVLFICLCYYYQILSFKSGDDLFKRPSFWITTSIFFYILLLTPFNLLYEELRINHPLLFKVFFSIHYFSFGIIFIALTNAFLCKKPITT